MNDDRLFPADPTTRDIARRLYQTIRDLPIISPHGHTDARWFARKRTLRRSRATLRRRRTTTSSACSTARASRSRNSACPRIDGGWVETDPRKIWRLFARHYHLFAGTPTRLWLDHSFEMLFGLTERLSARNADHHYDVIAEALQRPEFRPRALYERFNIEAIATTESAIDDLRWHTMIANSGWHGRVVDDLSARLGGRSRISPAFARISQSSARSRAKIRRPGPAISPRIGAGAPSSRRMARPRAIMATRARARPISSTARRRRCSQRVLARRSLRRRRRTVPRADAHRNGGDEPRRRTRHADPSGLLAQPQSARAWPLRPRQGRGYSDADRLRGRAEAPARPFRQREIADDHPVHARRDQLLARTRAARGPLSRASAGAALVVLRFGRRHAALPRAGDGDRGLLQHGRLQRRHPRVSLDPRSA